MPPRPVWWITLSKIWLRTEPQARRMPPPNLAPSADVLDAAIADDAVGDAAGLAGIVAAEVDGMGAEAVVLNQVAHREVVEKEAARVAVPHGLANTGILAAIEGEMGEFHVLAADEVH